MTVGLLLLLGIITTVQMRLSLRDSLGQQLHSESEIVGRDLAARSTDLVLLNDIIGMQKLISNTYLNYHDVRYAFILDVDGNVLAHSFESGFPVDLLSLNTEYQDNRNNTIVIETDEGLVWDTSVPILDGKAGLARVGLSDKSLNETLWKFTRQLFIVTIIVVLFGILIAFALTWVLTNPILELLDGTKQVAKGDFTIRLKRWANDEIGDLAGAFNSMTIDLGRLDEMHLEREELQRQLLDNVITVQEDERRRISRELHDSTSQSLTSLLVGLKTMSTLCEDEQVQAHAKDLRVVAARTLEEIHEISSRLRPSVLDDLGLNAALNHLADEWQSRHKTIVDRVIKEIDIELSEEIEITIYRVVQEALTNIAKHAEADSVSMLVETRSGTIAIIIEDNGIGFNPDIASSSNRLGLLGMRERTELLGGEFDIESQPGKGTTLFIRIPMKAGGREL
jgi:signal transduction histidine kinase